MRSILCSIFLIFQIGCSSSGFNRGELKQQMGSSKPQFDETEIKSAYNKKSNLPKPFKLAIYLKTPKIIPPAIEWRWTDKDKAVFEELAKTLKAEKMASDVFFISNLIVDGDEELRSLRLAAAKHQADAILIVSGAAQVDRYINPWGWSYALILPTFFVKGSEADMLFLVGAALWDVKNEYLYLTSEAEDVVHESYAPAFGKSDRELVDEAKLKGLQQLSEILHKMIRGEKSL